MTDQEASRRSRRILFTQLTRLAELIETDGAQWTAIQIGIKLSLLESYLSKFDREQTTIEQSSDDNEIDQRIRFEDLYSTLKEKLLTLKHALGKPTTTNDSSQGGNFSKAKSMLPAIQLPKFDGCYSKWCDFINVFKTLIHEDSQHSNNEKFQLLRSCLMGKASNIIQSLECIEENSHRALSLLDQRYSNPKLIFGTHINRLLTAPSVIRGSVQQLRDLVDCLNGELRALQSLGSKEQIAEVMLINIILPKLDPVTRSKWEESAPLNEIPSWVNFMQFLQRRCLTMEHMQGVGSILDNSQARKRDSTGRMVANVSIQSTSRRCLYCRTGDHFLYKCPNYLRFPTNERYKLIKRLKLCINCLRPGHGVKNCQASLCTLCSRRHHTTLHFNSEKIPETKSISSAENIEDKASSSQGKTDCLSTANINVPNNVLIATAVIDVSSHAGVKTTCRALLDSASQSSFITHRLVQQLASRQTSCDFSIRGIGSVGMKVKHKAQITIEARHGAFRTSVEALVLPNITSSQPNTFINTTDWKIPANLPLADPLFYQPARIDLLLGAEIFMKLLCIGQISLGHHRPVF